MKTFLSLLLAFFLSAFASAQDQIATGNITSTTCAGTGCVSLNVAGAGTGALQLSGTWVATAQFEGSVDGTNFTSLQAFPLSSSTSATSAAANGVWVFSAAGLSKVRVRASAYTSGTAVVTLRASHGTALSPAGTGGGGGGGAVTVADAADVAQGATTDAAVQGDSAGTLSAKLRGLLKQTDGYAVSGTLTNNGDTLAISTRGMASVSVYQPTAIGGWDGTVNFEATNDGVSWFALKTARQDDGQIITSFNPTTSFVLRFNVAGMQQFRLNVSARTVGFTTITMVASMAPYQSYQTTSLVDQSTANHLSIDGFGSAKVSLRNDAGSSILGTAGSADPDVLTVQGIASMTPLAVSATALPLPTGASTSALQTTGNSSLTSIDGKTPALGQATMAASSPVVIASNQTAFPVTANAGTNLNTSALALDATLTNRTQKSQVTDGTRDGTIKAASTLPLATDTAFVVTQRDALPTGANVIGHVIADSGSTTAVTGNVTVVQPTGTNLHTVGDTNNVTQFGSTNVSTGTGASGAGIPRVTAAYDSGVGATSTGTLLAASSTVSVATNGAATVIAQITATAVTGPFGNYMQCQASTDSGVTWGAVACYHLNLSNVFTSGSITALENYQVGNNFMIPAAGFTNVRMIAGALGFDNPVTLRLTTSTATPYQSTITIPSGTYVGILGAGGGTEEITASNTAAAAAQQGLVVSLSPNSPLPAGTNALGTVTVTDHDAELRLLNLIALANGRIPLLPCNAVRRTKCQAKTY